MLGCQFLHAHTHSMSDYGKTTCETQNMWDRNMVTMQMLTLLLTTCQMSVSNSGISSPSPPHPPATLLPGPPTAYFCYLRIPTWIKLCLGGSHLRLVLRAVSATHKHQQVGLCNWKITVHSSRVTVARGAARSRFSYKNP